MFVEKPHIPSAMVTVAALSGEYGEICDELNKLGVTAVKVSRHPKLFPPVASHSDLLLHHLGCNRIVAASGEGDYIKQLEHLGFEVNTSGMRLEPKYPYDIPLDGLRIGKYFFGKAEFIDPIIQKHCNENAIEIVPVKQGYAKCSTCIVSENAVITSDCGIEKACQGKRMDTLLIKSGYLSLPGYHYGFIGGCAGLIDKKTLAFTGDIKNHPDGNKILNFLRTHDVTAVTLRKGTPIDIGGILPLIQFDV